MSFFDSMFSVMGTAALVILFAVLISWFPWFFGTIALAIVVWVVFNIIRDLRG